MLESHSGDKKTSTPVTDEAKPYRDDTHNLARRYKVFNATHNHDLDAKSLTNGQTPLTLSIYGPREDAQKPQGQCI